MTSFDAANDGLEGGQPRAGLVLGWRFLTTALAVAALASLTALVVVVTVADVDALSTVALALAVIAFSAQLIISLADAQSSARQFNEVARVNTETRSLLAEVRATAESVLATQKGQFDAVLRAALDRAIPEAVRQAADEDAGEEPEDDSQSVIGFPRDQLEASIRANFQRALEDMQEGRSSQAVRRPGPRTAEQRSFLSRLKSWPEDSPSARQAVETFRSVNSREVVTLIRRAMQDVERAQSGKSPGGWTTPTPSIRSLEDKGILRLTDESPSGGSHEGRKWRTFTPEGIEVARLAVATGDAPRWLVKAFSAD